MRSLPPIHKRLVKYRSQTLKSRNNPAMVLFQTKHTKIEYRSTFTKRVGKKNAMYIIKECGILSHPGADTPLEIPLDQPDSSKKL